MKLFKKYLLTNLFKYIGFGTALYALLYPLEYNQSAPLDVLLICLLISVVCAVIYSRLVDWLLSTEHKTMEEFNHE